MRHHDDLQHSNSPEFTDIRDARIMQSILQDRIAKIGMMDWGVPPQIPSSSQSGN